MAHRKLAVLDKECGNKPLSGVGLKSQQSQRTQFMMADIMTLNMEWIIRKWFICGLD
jgi:hypothetical protein